ncbi:MAG: acyltransferase family protein [Clostridiales bacterium]|nr:acyltransferase family protein [Clostridiales bacterium]
MAIIYYAVPTCGGVPLESFLADFCKVCVAIFLVLSGYGLYKSWCSFEKKNMRNGKLPAKKQILFVKNHLLKLMFGYWFIYIIFVFMGLFLGRPFYAFYGLNPLYFLSDFLGLANLFGTPTVNATWWFMSIIIVYYLIFPLLVKIQKYSGELLLLISFCAVIFEFLPSFRQLRLWIFPFVLGMYLAQISGFERLDSKLKCLPNKIIFGVLAILVTAYIRIALFNNSIESDGVFACAIIMFSFGVLSRISILNRILEELGKYSGQIFMFHTFIYSYYFKSFIYSFKYSVLIFIVLAIVCYAVARLLEWLKHLLRYDKLMNKLVGV